MFEYFSKVRTSVDFGTHFQLKYIISCSASCQHVVNAWTYKLHCANCGQWTLAPIHLLNCCRWILAAAHCPKCRQWLCVAIHYPTKRSRFLIRFRHRFGSVINSWYVFSIEFPIFFFKYFCGSWHENGAEVVPQNRPKSIKHLTLYPRPSSWGILARFGINWVPFACTFRDLRWPFRALWCRF